jgi:hypothetical protein
VVRLPSAGADGIVLPTVVSVVRLPSAGADVVLPTAISVKLSHWEPVLICWRESASTAHDLVVSRGRGRRR